MKSKRIKLAVVVLVSALIFQACSAGLSSSTKEDDEIDNSLKFKVVAKDGYLSNILVYFCSLKKGKIAGPFSTNFNGVANPSFDKNLLESLVEDDQIYWWVVSSNSSAVTIDRNNPRLKSLSVGQVSMKSYLGRAIVIKNKALINQNLTNDQVLAKASVVTHFSNARSNLLEARWKQEGLLSGKVDPNNPLSTLTETNLKSMIQITQAVDQKLENESSATTHKMKLLATMTKAVIEFDVSRLLDGTDDQGLSNSSDTIFKVAENDFREVSSEFLDVYDEVYSEISLDLEDPEIINSIGSSTILSSVSAISKNQTRLAVASNLEDDTPRLSVEDITPVPTNSSFARYPGEIANYPSQSIEGILKAVPRYGAARGKFVFQQ